MDKIHKSVSRKAQRKKNGLFIFVLDLCNWDSSARALRTQKSWRLVGPNNWKNSCLTVKNKERHRLRALNDIHDRFSTSITSRTNSTTWLTVLKKRIWILLYRKWITPSLSNRETILSSNAALHKKRIHSPQAFSYYASHLCTIKISFLLLYLKLMRTMKLSAIVETVPSKLDLTKTLQTSQTLARHFQSALTSVSKQSYLR